MKNALIIALILTNVAGFLLWQKAEAKPGDTHYHALLATSCQEFKSRSTEFDVDCGCYVKRGYEAILEAQAGGMAFPDDKALAEKQYDCINLKKDLASDE